MFELVLILGDVKGYYDFFVRMWVYDDNGVVKIYFIVIVEL